MYICIQTHTRFKDLYTPLKFKDPNRCACVCVCVCVCARARARAKSYFSHVQLFATLWTRARQAPLFMGFSPYIGGGCHGNPQGIFPTQGSNLHLLHW